MVISLPVVMASALTLNFDVIADMIVGMALMKENAVSCIHLEINIKQIMVWVDQILILCFTYAIYLAFFCLKIIY